MYKRQAHAGSRCGRALNLSYYHYGTGFDFFGNARDRKFIGGLRNFGFVVFVFGCRGCCGGSFFLQTEICGKGERNNAYRKTKSGNNPQSGIAAASFFFRFLVFRLFGLGNFFFGFFRRDSYFGFRGNIFFGNFFFCLLYTSRCV